MSFASLTQAGKAAMSSRFLRFGRIGAFRGLGEEVVRGLDRLAVAGAVALGVTAAKGCSGS